MTRPGWPAAWPGGGLLAQPAQAQTCCAAYDIYLFNSNYFIYAHAHNYPVETTNSLAESQWWQLINPATINRINNQGAGTAYEVELENTGECLNNVPYKTIAIVELDSCVSNDLYEYYWPDQAAPGVDYLRNVEQSYIYGNEYAYLTANGCGVSSSGAYILTDRPPGCGSNAWWEFDEI